MIDAYKMENLKAQTTLRDKSTARTKKDTTDLQFKKVEIIGSKKELTCLLFNLLTSVTRGCYLVEKLVKKKV